MYKKKLRNYKIFERVKTRFDDKKTKKNLYKLYINYLNKYKSLYFLFVHK